MPPLGCIEAILISRGLFFILWWFQIHKLIEQVAKNSCCLFQGFDEWEA
jgi:hypothetical protein